MINDSDGSELIRAIYKKDFNLVNQLLETNVNVNWQNSKLETVLMIAVSRPAIEEDVATMVGNLIAKGADVNIRDKKGRTALMHAAGFGFGHMLVINKILIAGADIDAQDNDLDTALIYGVKYKHPASVSQLLSMGADVNKTNMLGNTALMLAIKTGYADMVEEILQNGADRNIMNNEGMTALDIAYRMGDSYRKLVHLLENESSESE